MNLPVDFLKEIESYRAPQLQGLAGALSADAEVSVRVNVGKNVAVRPGAERVPWCGSGFYLPGRVSFTFDPAMHQGLYYVQDASSMAIQSIVGQLVSGMGAVRYLDSCAAPGGKTTAAMDALPPGSLVVANEYDFKRAGVLAENVEKWGCGNVLVSRGDTVRFRKFPDFFDIIAADVPCSGEGMMRKDAEAVAQWSLSLVADCVVRQRKIVGNLWDALRPGGYMIYSTCTFNIHENEEVVDWITGHLGGETVKLDIGGFEGVADGVGTRHHCYRFIPGVIRGEGLFVSVIRKNDAEECRPVKKTKGQMPDRRVDAYRSVLSSWLDGDFCFQSYGDDVYAIAEDVCGDMAVLDKGLDVMHRGIHVATIKGRDLVPAQGLAMSQALRRGCFTEVEMDYSRSVAYLRRETLTLPEGVSRGYVLITYKGRPLGFVKNLGTRANNMYPQPWRILSSHLPEDPPYVLSCDL